MVVLAATAAAVVVTMLLEIPPVAAAETVAMINSGSLMNLLLKTVYPHSPLPPVYLALHLCILLSSSMIINLYSIIYQ